MQYGDWAQSPIPNPHILEIINFNKFYKLIEKYKIKLPFLKNVKSKFTK